MEFFLHSLSLSLYFIQLFESERNAFKNNICLFSMDTSSSESSRWLNEVQARSFSPQIWAIVKINFLSKYL